MSGNILSSLLSKPAVLITDEKTGLNIWPNIKVLSVDFNNGSENTDNPVQTASDGGKVVVESHDIEASKVLRPSMVVLEAGTTDISTVESIIQAFYRTDTVFTIFSKSMIGERMALVEADFENGPDVMSGTKMTLKFEQTSPVKPEGYVPAQPSDSSLSTIGTQLLAKAKNGVAGLAASIKSKVGM